MKECACEKLLGNVAMQVQEQLLGLFEATHRRVIVIAGVTGVGKTQASIELAERIGGEIISADSVQVYRSMDIGTAKASLEDRKRVRHHLIDIKNLDESFTVVDFYEEAKACIQDIRVRGKVPIVVGGTGFYLHTLLYGPPSGPPADLAIRAMLEKDIEKFGIEPFFEKLEKFDPVYAATITKNDIHKIVRALEIIEVSGKPVSSFCWKDKKPEGYFDFRPWFFHMPRPTLYKKLEHRCDEMLAKGFLLEVVRLDRAGIRHNTTARQAIGYKQVLEFLETAQTEADYKCFVEAFKQATRHLVKRQCTWFRKEPLFRWLDISTYSKDELLELLISDYESDQTLELG